MKVSIIHFDPYIGGETTLCNSLSAILKTKHEVKIMHPVHLNKKNKPRIDSKWGTVKDAEYLSYSQVEENSRDSDVIFCLNGKHVKGSVKSDKRKLSLEDALSFFGQFENRDFIFYEHGFHTWRLYNYELLFSELMKKGNTIRVLTNTKMAIEFYKTKGYNAYLCRQPFDVDLYKPITSNSTDTVNICFNSRYSATKGPHIILPFFIDHLQKGKNFKLNFRGNLGDPVSIWHNIKHYFLENKDDIVMKGYATDISEVYDQQDYTIYAGYQTKEERGKIEYSILESIFYNIPIIAHPDVFLHFKYEEYGVTEEKLRKSFIELTPENLSSIIDKTFDGTSYAIEASSILQDFLPEKILERFEHCMASPSSLGGRKTTSLF